MIKAQNIITTWFTQFVTTLKSLPKGVWAVIVAAFIIGFLIRGGDTGSTGDVAQTMQHTHEKESQAQWWTCSMHPQIKLPEPGQCPICFMDLIPLETGDSDEGPRELKMSATAVKLAEISTQTVRRSVAQAKVRLSGKVEYDETRLGKITAWVPGRLERLYVDYTGVTVNKGDALVELYSPSLYAAQEELLQALKNTQNVRQGLARESALITLEAAREKLKLLGLTSEQIQEIESRGTSIDQVKIYSPMSGVVVHKNAIEGMYVSRGTKIYEIADLSRVWIVLDAYESDLPWLKLGQNVEFTVEALPGQVFTGQIVFIDPVLDDKTRTIKVRLNLDNSKGLLKPGMFVRATVYSNIEKAPGGKKQPLLIPASAVLRTGKRAVVYVKVPGTEEPTFEGREVELGARAGDDYIVISGLQEGEEVVVKGNFKIDSAMQIMAKPSMMSPEGGVAMTGHENHGASPTAKPQTKSTEQTKTKDERFKVSENFHTALTSVYNAYFSAQAALANDDLKKSKNDLSSLGEAVRAIDSKNAGLQGTAEQRWNEYQKELQNHTQHAQHWSTIAEVRKAFESISNTLLTIEKEFGHGGDQTFYEIFCSMAFDKAGAVWLQTEKEVKNPYFGASMLRCGEVRSEMKPVSQTQHEHGEGK